MTVTEESRHRLHQALDRSIGEEEATTLMEHLPPVGWSDVATKQDLAHLRTATKTDLDHLREHVDDRFESVDLLHRRFDAMEARLTHQFWQFLTLIVAVGGVVLTVLQLTKG